MIIKVRYSKTLEGSLNPSCVLFKVIDQNLFKTQSAFFGQNTHHPPTFISTIKPQIVGWPKMNNYLLNNKKGKEFYMKLYGIQLMDKSCQKMSDILGP